MENGKEKRISEAYLVDAVSYTEAEGRITRELSGIAQGEFDITALKRSSITEWVQSNDENDDRLFKSRVAIIDADQLTGKEKRTNLHFLVAGATLERALENLHESLSTYIIPWEIVSLSDTNFADVFPYEATAPEKNDKEE